MVELLNNMMDEPCGLGDATPLAEGQDSEGMVVLVGGQAYDLGSVGDSESVTLADERGLSVYSDTDGDGEVDHVATVLFDGSWETWNALSETSEEGISEWGAYDWESHSRGAWE